MRCAPPRGNGQPPACPHTPSTNPMAALKADPSGSVECAAIRPTKRARAAKVRFRGKRGRIAAMPNWPTAADSAALKGATSSAKAGTPANSNEHCPPGFAVASQIGRGPVDRAGRTAVPSSSGCASGASGHHSSPCPASGNCSKHGEHCQRCTAGRYRGQIGRSTPPINAPPPITALSCTTSPHDPRAQHDRSSKAGGADDYYARGLAGCSLRCVEEMQKKRQHSEMELARSASAPGRWAAGAGRSPEDRRTTNRFPPSAALDHGVNWIDTPPSTVLIIRGGGGARPATAPIIRTCSSAPVPGTRNARFRRY